MASTTVKSIQCSCSSCVCVVDPNNAIVKEGKYYCCQGCAEGHVNGNGSGNSGCGCNS